MAVKLDEVANFADWLVKRWHSLQGLIAIEIVVLIVGIFFILYPISWLTWITISTKLLILLVVITCIPLFWKIAHIPRKNSTDATGIAIAIDCESEREKLRIKNDLILLLDEKLSSRGLRVNVFELGDYHTKVINKAKEKRIEYIHKTRANILLAGVCKTRKENGKDSYVLNLNVAVSHKAIPLETSNAFSSDIRRVMPKMVTISEEHEIKGFDLTLNILSLGVMYIVGTAFLVSGDPYSAFDIHYNLYKQLNSTQEDKYVINLKELLAIRIINSAFLITRLLYNAKPDGYLDKLNFYSTVVTDLSQYSYVAHIWKTIYFFLKSRDIRVLSKPTLV